MIFCRRCERDCPRAEWRKREAVDVDGEERYVYVHEPAYKLCGWRTALVKRSKLAATAH